MSIGVILTGVGVITASIGFFLKGTFKLVLIIAGVLAFLSGILMIITAKSAGAAKDESKSTGKLGATYTGGTSTGTENQGKQMAPTNSTTDSSGTNTGKAGKLGTTISTNPKDYSNQPPPIPVGNCGYDTSIPWRIILDKGRPRWVGRECKEITKLGKKSCSCTTLNLEAVPKPTFP